MSQWADAERKLSPESSAEPGQWRTSRVPYLRGFMDAASDPAVKKLCGVFASQVAKTEAVNNMLGQRIRHRPGPMLIVYPTLKMAEAWSKDRLAPMLRDTPCLRGRVRDARSRDSGNTVLHKQFPGGHLTIAGANSPASLSSRPVRDVYFDEVDRFPASAGTEGNPVVLAETRTRAFWDARKVYISSPTTKGASQIEVVWLQSDQRRWFVPCADCGTFQTFKWAQVQWEKDEESGAHRPETAVYVCEQCGSAWNDAARWAASRRGEWRATAPFRGCAGFHVNALAAPWESCRLEPLVRQWLEAQGNPERLKVFLNTVLAEWWEEEYRGIKADLGARVEKYARRDGVIAVPAGVALLVAGVDTQDNRLELSVYGYGAGFESWLLIHQVLLGDPAAPLVWEDLDRLLMRSWPRDGEGYELIRGVCVDTAGHHTQAAYDFCGPRYQRTTADGGRQFVFATIGRGGPGDVWPRTPSLRNTKVPLWTVRVDAAKEQIYGRLGIVEPGPGFVHFPDTMTKPFFDGLTSERLVTRTDRKNFTRRVWEKKTLGARNEPLDCAVLAYAALCGLQAMGYDLASQVAAMSQRIVFHTPPEAAVAQSAAPAPQRPPPVDSWLGDTRGWLGR